MQAIVLKQINGSQNNPIKLRAKSAYLQSRNQIKYFKENRLNQYTSKLMSAINSHILPNHQISEEPNMRRLSQNDPEPNAPKVRCKAITIKHKKYENEKDKPIRTKKHIKNHHERISFETKMLKNEKQIAQNFKFPSQKVLIPKEKVIPLTCSQKQQYVIEICRIIKDNRQVLYEQNSKQHKNFQKSQIKKYRGFQTQKQHKNPLVTFNYDGSIINVNPTRKNSLIDCEAKQIEKAYITNLYKNQNIQKRESKKLQKIQNFFLNHQKLQQIQSKYIENFFKIPWNPKVYHEEINIRDKKIQKQTKLKSQKMMAPLFKKCCDQKSIVKVANHQIYREILITKPIKITKQNIGEGELLHYLEGFQQNKQMKQQKNKNSCYDGSISKNQQINSKNIKNFNQSINQKMKKFYLQKKKAHLSKRSRNTILRENKNIFI